MTKRSKRRGPKPKPPIEYFPPATEEIDRYAFAVCHELGEKIDSTFNDPDMRRELAVFLKVVATIYAKHLNKGIGMTTPLDNEN